MGAIWATSWGRQYGAHYENKKLANEGRIYRLWPDGYQSQVPARSSKKLADWSIEELLTDLASHVPAWRTNAQEELIRRGAGVIDPLRTALRKDDISTALETWIVWTIGRIDPSQSWFAATQNQKIQSLRLQAYHRTATANIIA